MILLIRNFQKKEYTIEEITCAFNEARDGIDIEKNQNIVINSNRVSIILDFARFVKGCDIERLEDATIKCSEYITSFACLVKGANITKLEDAIISINDPEKFYFFAAAVLRYINTSKLDIEKLRKAIADIDDEKQYYVKKFNELFPKKKYTPEDVSNALSAAMNKFCVEENQKIVMEYGSINDIINFANFVEEANIEKIKNFIIANRSIAEIACFENNILNKIKSKQEKNSKPIQETQSNFTDRFKANLKEGAYQGLANSVISNLQTLIAGYAQNSNLKEEQIKAISYLLESEYGFIFLSMIVGAGSQFIEIPNINNEHIQKVADKCIQNSSGKFVEIIAESFSNVLKNIESSKLRVEQVESNQDDVCLDEEEQLQNFLIN